MIERYDGREFHGFRDLLVASIMDGDSSRIEGYKVDYSNGERIPFDYTLKTYRDPRSAKDKLLTIGVLSPAQYLIFDQGNLQENLSGPMKGAGIQPKDRIIWVDGEVVFSVKQLSSVVNESTAFLTVQRGSEIFQTRAPRVHMDELKMSAVERAEIDDWQHEAGVKGRLQDLYFIPYNLSPVADVESRLRFIDEQDQLRAFQTCQRCAYFNPLEEGDKILAIDGIPVHSSSQILQQLQTRRVLVIVDRDPAALEKIVWTKADDQFDAFSTSDLDAIVSSIGTSKPHAVSGKLHLLRPIAPQPLAEHPLTPEQKSQLAQEFAESKKRTEAIQDPQQRTEQLRELEQSQRKLILGVPLKDREVRYNPTPQRQFVSVFEDTWRTLSGLVSGVLNPKYVSGPVGIVHVVHNSWMVGTKEALFWMAVISLNLGIINLLPIPVLDGGHIMFSLLEMIRKRPLRSKTMDRLVIPFIGLLIGLFLYITYQDIARLFSKFF